MPFSMIIFLAAESSNMHVLKSKLGLIYLNTYLIKNINGYFGAKELVSSKRT